MLCCIPLGVSWSYNISFQKKLTICKFEGSRKEFWAFVGGLRTGVLLPCMKSVEEVSVTSTKGKLEVLEKHLSIWVGLVYIVISRFQ